MVKNLKFNKNGINLSFVIDDSGQLLLEHIGSRKGNSENTALPFNQAIEIQMSGANPDGHNGFKHCRKQTCSPLIYNAHSETESEIVFHLTSNELDVHLHYVFFDGVKVVSSYADVKNISDEPVGLEYISSFCAYGLDMNEIFIPHTCWCRELDWRSYKPEQLGYSHVTDVSTKRIAVSSTGTWSTKEYLPMGCVIGNTDTLLWQIEHNGSWNWEISDLNSGLYLKLSGPSEQENHWWKQLLPGDNFTTVKAAVCITDGGFDDAVAEMTLYRRKIAYRSKSDNNLPVIFNDYMNCLNADPTTEKEIPVIRAAKKAGAEIFCMDAGWYADGAWWETVGEWKPCDKRFKNGMKEVFDLICQLDMIPGIWLEPEVMGINCPILDKFDDDCFFRRHGKRVVDRGRYQFDFRNRKVTDFLNSVIDGLISDYGIRYFKFDYNIDGGIGTEIDSDSFGDGLLQCNEAYLDWRRSLNKKYPDIIIENCSSGGMRMDYASLSVSSVQSLTDAYDYPIIAKIAAMSSTAVIPEQSAVWSVPLKDESKNQLVYHMVNTMFKRVHLSGNIPWLDEEKFAIIKEGVDYYKSVRNEIPGLLPFYPLGLVHFESDFTCCGYQNSEKAFICLGRLGDTENVIVPVTFDIKNVTVAYPKDSKCGLQYTGRQISVSLEKDSAVVIEISKG